MAQLFALNTEKNLVAARQAQPRKDYICPECFSPVRVRKGVKMRDHFFHLHSMEGCSQKNKSETHLLLQLEIKKIFNDHEVFLEHPFPEISRISDVCIPEQKIIFEVQCSPICRQEAAARTFEYRSCGFDVIWILHDKRYGQQKAKKFELFLHDFPHYFTNFSPDCGGIIYDIASVFHKGRRVILSDPLEVDISKIRRLKPETPRYPQAAKKRLKNWPLFLENDLLFHLFKQPSGPLIQRLFAYENRPSNSFLSFMREGFNFAKDHLNQFLDMVIEANL